VFFNVEAQAAARAFSPAARCWTFIQAVRNAIELFGSLFRESEPEEATD